MSVSSAAPYFFIRYAKKSFKSASLMLGKVACESGALGYLFEVSARDLLLQVKALPPAEQRRLMDAMMDLDVSTLQPSAPLQVPDFEAYWERLHVLGMPRWTAEQTAELDRWLAGEEEG